LSIDVDGDSRQDLVTLSVGASVTGHVATRRSGFQDVTSVDTSLPGDMAVVGGADFDADHDADLWAVSTDGTLRVYGGTGWTDLLHTAALPSGAPVRVAMSDRDGGNLPEVFALYQVGGSARVEVLRLSGGAWVLDQAVPLAKPVESILSIAADDYDGDGRADLQILESSGRIEAYVGNSSTGRPIEDWFKLRDPDCVDPVRLVFEGSFYDDDASVHRNGIEAVAAAGITVGCNPPFNDKFCPERELTRAQAATFLARARDLPDPGQDYFTDDDGHILEAGINRVAAEGITKGCNPPANTRFCPDRNMTRAEFAAFMARAMTLPTTSTDYFTDDDGHILEGAINRLAEAGITKGCNPPVNDHFCPRGLVTRAETATFLTRALDLG
jgi:hypothetical protein